MADRDILDLVLCSVALVHLPLIDRGGTIDLSRGFLFILGGRPFSNYACRTPGYLRGQRNLRCLTEKVRCTENAYIKA